MESSTRRTGFVYDEIYLEHDTGHGHVERPDRLSFCLRALKQSGFWNQLHHIEATPATLDQLCYVHECDHIDRVKSHCQREIPLDYDTPVSKQSFDIALLAAGGVLRAVDQVIAGDVDNAFALVRPPGHHATPNRAMGFCLFN
ncbi:MAG: histone deacetylase, partial [Candidatus Poribacteria bacterium]|nr:histone deacetylase [Candidatus Poribacteria bacterium]